MDKIIEIAQKLGVTAWVGLWAGVAFSVMLLALLGSWGSDRAQANHTFQLEALAAKVEKQSERIAELEEEVIQLTVDQRGPAVGRRLNVSNRDDICERSPGIQHELLSNIFGHNSCSLVSSRDLMSITELSISSRLNAGDLDGFENLHTLRIYTDKRPPHGLLDDLPNLQNFLAEWSGYCGTKLNVNGVPREVREGNCRVSFGDH